MILLNCDMHIYSQTCLASMRMRFGPFPVVIIHNQSAVISSLKVTSSALSLSLLDRVWISAYARRRAEEVNIELEGQHPMYTPSTPHTHPAPHIDTQHPTNTPSTPHTHPAPHAYTQHPMYTPSYPMYTSSTPCTHPAPHVHTQHPTYTLSTPRTHLVLSSQLLCPKSPMVHLPLPP